ETKLALQLFKRRRGRIAENELRTETFSQTADQRFGGQLGASFMGGAHGDQDGVFERREIAALPKFQFLLEIAGEIVVPCELDRWTEGRVGLDENFTRRFTASGPAGDLGEQLKRPFARAEIRHVQREIGVDDPDQRHVRKMKALR